MADKTFGSSEGLTILAEDQATPASGMVNYITSSYQSGWQNGDIKGAFLSDTDDTDLVGSGELVTNGTFDTDVTGWTFQGTATDTSTAGFLSGTTGPSSNLLAHQVITTVVGKTYRIDITTGPASTAVYISPTTAGGLTIGSTGFATSGNKTLTFVATSTTTYLSIMSVGINSNASIDNISVKLADEDRSVKNNGLIVTGNITRSPVATGADLVAYSGFSASNYLEQPYNSDLDFGTGDFCVMGWVKPVIGNKAILTRQDLGGTGFGGAGYFVTSTINLTPRFVVSGNTLNATSALSSGVWQHLCFVRSGGVAKIYINGVASGSSSSLNTTVDNTSGRLLLGVLQYDGNIVDAGNSLALLRISATAPTAEQIAKIYEDEKVLFEENAQATLYGSSDAVTALAHDPDTDLLHVGTSAGRSVFEGLRRVGNTTTSVSTSISASGGLIVEK